ncbi:MAG TPA: FAD-dependent oxidoreductase [Acidimicrobiia bacterium]|nr:FAD-dependent oxidoreductase [Acidimicrobiia bacterium]
MSDTVRPSIVLVDDDPEVLASVERDIRHRYASSYRVVSAGSGADALSLVDRLMVREDPVALVVADQRMPGLTGTEVLARVAEQLPDTKRVLLTAYADTDAAISAINRAHIHYYILKPWDPPEERLYPVLDDLLEDWQAVGRASTQAGIRVLGDRWSAESHELREFLSRNMVPFRWLEVGRTREADTTLKALGDDVRLPVVMLDDGAVISRATPADVAEAVGMRATPDTEFYDLAVVGAGPAGLAAAVYGSSEGLSTAVVESDAPGGQAGTSSRIENYLGFPQGVSGEDLARRALTQARKFGASMISPRRAVRLHREDPYRVLELDDGSLLRCSAVIVATGVQYRELEVPGAERLRGRGLYYGSASTEAQGLTGEQVIVVGGANSAGQAAVHLARFAERVLVLVRGPAIEARMSSYLIAQLAEIPQVEIRLETEVAEVHGQDHLEAATLRSPAGEERLETAAAFVFIGARPRTEWLDTTVTRDDRGFILTGQSVSDAGKWALDRSPMLLETSMPGVFAVGDVRSDSVKRVASAVGEGSVAVHLVHAYLSI